MDTTELLKGGRSWVCRSVAGRRSGSNIYSHCVSLLGVATLNCACSCCLLGGSLESVVSGDLTRGCLRAVGFVGVIAQVGCFCLDLRLAYCEQSESVIIDSSMARLAARARHLCDPGKHPGGPRPPALPAAHGGPSESVVSGEVGTALKLNWNRVCPHSAHSFLPEFITH